MGSDHFRRLEYMYHASPVSQLYQPTLEVSKGESVLRMPVKTEFFHAAQALHGSVIFKALDDAAFFAANSLEEDFFVLTVSFNIHLLRPVSEGTLRAEGRVVSASKKLIVAESVLFVDANKRVAMGSGSFMRSRIRLDEVPSYSVPHPTAET